MSRTRGAGRSGPGALRSEAAVRPAEPGAAERHRADRDAADPHRPDRDAADLDGTDRGAADLHGTDRDAADLRPIDPGVPAGADPAHPGGPWWSALTRSCAPAWWRCSAPTPRSRSSASPQTVGRHWPLSPTPTPTWC